MPQLSYDLLKHDRGDSQSKEMSLLTSSRFVTYISETSFTMNSVELSKQVYVQLAEESSYQRTTSALRCVTNDIMADSLAYDQNTQDKSPSEIFILLNS